jgi:hypothetical protein
LFDGNCLIGTTYVTLRYTKEWFDQQMTADYSMSELDKDNVLTNLKNKTFYKKGGWCYSEIQMKDFPANGVFKYDRNMAKVFDVAPGCEILSFKPNNTEASWEPISGITIEDDCDAVECLVANRTIGVSTNDSLAVFDRNTGGLRRISPELANARTRIPVFKKRPLFMHGSVGTTEDGWFLGSMISDGWISDRYVGHAKLDVNILDKVTKYIVDRYPNTNVRTYDDDNSSGLKLGRAKKRHYYGSDALSHCHGLNIYAEPAHSALTKHIGRDRLLRSSESFLWGLLSGLIDGDGTICHNAADGRCSIRLFTSSCYLVEDLKLLAYLLGLRFCATMTGPRNNSNRSWVVVLSTVDSYEILDRLDVVGERNRMLVALWKQQTSRKSNTDVVPLTYDEAIELKELALQCMDAGLYDATVESGNGYVNRHKLLQYIDHIPVGSALYNRIRATEVIWDYPKKIASLGKQKVYDFLVETTKVFVVNEGVVVYDTVNYVPILSDEANAECEEHIKSISNYLAPNGDLNINFDDLISMTMHNLTLDDVLKEKK